MTELELALARTQLNLYRLATTVARVDCAGLIETHQRAVYFHLRITETLIELESCECPSVS